MEKEIISKILNCAIRAPSTHNSQPWLFKIKPNGVSVFYNKNLKLPEADKEGRDLYISMGCLLENMKIAAIEFGFDVIIDISIDEKTQHVAEVVFTPRKEGEKENSNIFNQIFNRVNARGLFLDEKIDESDLSEVWSIVEKFKKYQISLTILNKKNDIIKVAETTQKAMEYAYCRPSFRKEMSHWMNGNLSLKKQGIPGYSLKMPLLVSIIIPFIIRFFNIGKFLGNLNLKSIKSAPLIFVLSSKNNTQENWIHVGECAERLMLSLQSKGFQTSIYVGSIEIENLYKEIQTLTGLTEDRPQFVFAVGHISGYHKITPRHQLKDKII